MKNSLTLSKIKDRDNELILEIENKKELLLNNKKSFSLFEEKVDSLISDIKQYASSISSIEYYYILNDIVTKWQLLFLSIFDHPKEIEIIPTPSQLEFPNRTVSNIFLKRFLFQITPAILKRPTAVLFSCNDYLSAASARLIEL
ncbi:MAG: hypothetical protein D3910_09560, partial [Candidatus Electrothrix sp. ATG2]|nr:hypothetical protein [Candidatus Electrothrix sp. ATG2]